MRFTRLVLEHLILLTLGASISLASPLPPESVAPPVFVGFSGSGTLLLKRTRDSDDLSEDGVTVNEHPVKDIAEFRNAVETHGAGKIHVSTGDYAAKLSVNKDVVPAEDVLDVAERLLRMHLNKE